ncbi:hypothetical protein [Paeniglutamicibacter cryotolerans]|uniref:Transposase n=1 Tax=Paeniglutamicibacter cryotolerans TaxID=670079 RepID=A0A839QFY6_9MICC|nr:hypothetical protein [Paeniglutamicibacter cryotolerans]MBB2994533.1 hypothetical protein [Paeniglutamicibacter cryotolerans]
MTQRVTVRDIEYHEEALLLQIVRRGGSGPVVTWRRAQMVLLSARGMDVASLAEVAFTSPDAGPRRPAPLQRRRLRVPASPRRRRTPGEIH